MNSSIMWIVLGVLIAVVVGFLLVSTFLDKRKKKKLKAEQIREYKAMRDSLGRVAISLNIIAKYNQKLLAKFIPSVGKISMSTINQAIHREIKALVQGKALEKIGDEEIRKAVLVHLEKLLNDKSNNWNKKDEKSLLFFKTIEKNLKNKENYEEFKAEYESEIKTVYELILHPERKVIAKEKIIVDDVPVAKNLQSEKSPRKFAKIKKIFSRSKK